MIRIYLLFLVVFAIQSHAINVVFRLDDPTLQADSVSLRVVHLFNEKQVPLSIAMVACDSAELPIVPINKLDSALITQYNSKNVEIALHGLTHRKIKKDGEFDALDYKEAVRRIKRGKELIESYIQDTIITFIPPFNFYDDSTLIAMVDNSLSILSADVYLKFYHPSIQYYPETLGHLMDQKGIWQATEDAIFGCKQKDAICVVMFHTYDLPDEASWLRLGALLDACKADNDVQMHTFRSLYESGNTSSQYRYRANQLHSLLQKHLLHPGVLHTTWLCWLVHVLNALIYAILPLLALLIGWCAFKRKKVALSKPLVGVGILLSLVFCALAILQIGTPLKVLAADVALSGCLLVWGISKLRK